MSFAKEVFDVLAKDLDNNSVSSAASSVRMGRRDSFDSLDSNSVMVGGDDAATSATSAITTRGM